jgi:hypothetical protein
MNCPRCNGTPDECNQDCTCASCGAYACSGECRLNSDEILDQYESAMKNYYAALDSDDPVADALLVRASALYTDYDRALQAEFDVSVEPTPLAFYNVSK